MAGLDSRVCMAGLESPGFVLWGLQIQHTVDSPGEQFWGDRRQRDRTTTLTRNNTAHRTCSMGRKKH